jgi:hypothetical protein
MYEDEGVSAVNDDGFENLAWMRKRLIDSSLRKFFELAVKSA